MGLCLEKLVQFETIIWEEEVGEYDEWLFVDLVFRSGVEIVALGHMLLNRTVLVILACNFFFIFGFSLFDVT